MSSANLLSNYVDNDSHGPRTATHNPDQVQFSNCETIADALAELQERSIFGELEGPYT